MNVDVKEVKKQTHMLVIGIYWNSFTVKNLQGRIVACGMNCDAFNVPELKPRVKALSYVFEVLERAKGPARYVADHFSFSFVVLWPRYVAALQCREREREEQSRTDPYRQQEQQQQLMGQFRSVSFWATFHIQQSETSQPNIYKQKSAAPAQ